VLSTGPYFYPLLLRKIIMKTAILSMAILTALIASPVFAASTQAADAPQASQVTSNDTAPATRVGGWTAPSQVTHEKTRAEVRQELIQAEKDGQLDYLDSVVYAHS
jgi:hypothetical protein